MHPLEEKDSSPLEDTEITRLIKVSRELGYRKQDKIPERNLVDFKPTSITQIATATDNKMTETIGGSESADLAEKVRGENVSENTVTPDNNSSTNMPNLESVDNEPNSENTLEKKEISEPVDSISTTISDTLENPSVSSNIIGEHSLEDQGLEAGSAEDSPIEEEPVTEKKPVVATQNITASIEKAKQEGIEIGKKAAFTDLEAIQKEALENFQTIMDNMKKKEAVDKTVLTQSILSTITRLASERAGTIIDEHPETFKNKIISFADKIEQASTNLILNLNPVDADLLKKVLSESLSDKKVEIRKNSELFRGDFIFQMGAVEIGDLFSEQISIEEKEKGPTIKNENSQIENEKLEQALETDEREEPQETGKGNMSEIDDDRR